MGQKPKSKTNDLIIENLTKELDNIRVHLSKKSFKEKFNYSLKAVINHIGFNDIGHYTLYMKISNKWYYFNDSTVNEVPFDLVKSSALGKSYNYGVNNCYCLLYDQGK